MRLLDTDTLSRLWANHPLVVERLAECSETEIGITSITRCEVLRVRCENLLKAARTDEVIVAQRRLDRSERLLGQLIVVPFDDAAAQSLERLEKVRKLRSIG